MKRTILIIFLSFLSGTILAFPQLEGGCYVITADEDLRGQFIQLEKGSTVVFRGGRLCNGFLVGNDSRIERQEEGPVFDEVQLNGTWSGSITDEAFVYREGADHYRIVASMFRFNEVTFSRSIYRVGIWSPIYINPMSQVVHGNGVIFHITSEKGELETRKWGRVYKRETLFCNALQEEGNQYYEFNDLTVLDNRDLLGEPGWGEDIRHFYNYSYFMLIGREVSFNRVFSDGAGILEKVYNFRNPIDRISFRGCSVRTSQFAVEIQNVSGHSEAVRCGKIVFDSCSFYQYAAQKYVGLLSVTGTVPTDSLLIRNCVFDGTEKAGNLELTLARNIEVTGCSFVNHFLQSEPETSIRDFYIHGNTFRFTRRIGPHGYSIGGAHIRFVSNVLDFENDVAPIRVIGPVETFDEWDNKYYLITGKQRKKVRDNPFRKSEKPGVPGRLGDFLRTLYYRF